MPIADCFSPVGPQFGQTLFDQPVSTEFVFYLATVEQFTVPRGAHPPVAMPGSARILGIPLQLRNPFANEVSEHGSTSFNGKPKAPALMNLGTSHGPVAFGLPLNDLTAR
jgi:hypothetical protein